MTTSTERNRKWVTAHRDVHNARCLDYYRRNKEEINRKRRKKYDPQKRRYEHEVDRLVARLGCSRAEARHYLENF